MLLLSGGQDSVALAYLVRPAVAITVDYGQLPAEAEILASAEVSRCLGIEHHVLAVEGSALGSGDLAGSPPLRMAPASDWWPFRNQLLVTVAATAALLHFCDEVLLATVATDQTHSDGSSEFVAMLDRLLRMQEGNIGLRAPAAGMSTAELVRASGIPAEVFAWAHSCHKSNVACGRCRGCVKHREVMYELGQTVY